MASSRLQAAAKWRIAEWASGRPYQSLPPNLLPADLSDAFAMQRALIAERGATICGYKVAASSVAAQVMAGLAGPIPGTLVTEDLYVSPVKLHRKAFQDLGIEAEICFRIGKDVDVDVDTFRPEDLIPFIDAAMPGIELADKRHADFATLNVLDLIADNTWCAGIIVGEPRLDWRAWDLGAVAGNISLDGKVHSEGVGADVMGHPLNSLAWLVKDLAKEGVKLTAGMLVMTGTMVATVWISDVRHVLVDMGAFGKVELELADD
jgi:2-keto-4-pentenoate hydratase